MHINDYVSQHHADWQAQNATDQQVWLQIFNHFKGEHSVVGYAAAEAGLKLHKEMVAAKASFLPLPVINDWVAPDILPVPTFDGVAV